MMTKYNVIGLNSARNCLRYIIRAYEIKELYVPYYICPTIRNAVYKESCKILYYHIDEKFSPLIDFPKESYILYPNYFGICSSIVEELSTKYKNLIVDNAHSFFSKPRGLASFNSIRKFFPNIRNGAFLSINKEINNNFIKDNYFYENVFLEEEENIKNEYFIDNQEIKIISDCTFSYFSNLNIDSEKNKIRKRFDDFHLEFSDINELKFNLNADDIPYKYPLLISNENLLKDVILFLKQKEIYPLRFWQKIPDNYPESIFYNNLLVL